MNKILFCNLDLLRKSIILEENIEYDITGFKPDELKNTRDELKDVLLKLAEEDSNTIVFYSRKTMDLDSAKHHFSEEVFKFATRKNVQDYVNKYIDKSNNFVFVGAKDQDFLEAVHSRALYIVPCWLPLEEKAQRYGVHVENPVQLYKFILTLNNQNVWYSKLVIDGKTTVYSLVDARFGYYAKTTAEKEIVSGFQELLKDDMSHKYHRILLYHFLAGMTNTTEFDDIEIFGMIPSSNCQLNKYVYEFMTQIRELKGKSLPKKCYERDTPIEDRNLIIRHTSKTQNHDGGRSSDQRINLGASDEFDTLMINPYYKNKIDTLRRKSRLNVCIFDDYMTHGNSFNALRNMLNTLKANKILFVSIGFFGKSFQLREYNLNGDLYKGGFQYELLSSKSLNDYEINEKAKEEVSNLRDIFYGR